MSKNIIKWLIYSICTYLLYLGISKYNLGYSGKLSDLLSFLSIAIGFCITSLSLIATTKFSKNLYSRQSKNSNDKTLLHELVQIFQSANSFFLTTICLIICYLFIENIFEFKKNLICTTYTEEQHIEIKNIFQSCITSFIFISLYKFQKLIQILGKYAIQAAKEQ